jgi:hypothetical protein
VLVEIANEIDASTYGHEGYLRKNLPDLIGLVRASFEERKAGYRPPVSTSYTGSGMRLEPPASADFVPVHGNYQAAALKGERTAELMRAAPARPVVFSEDNNGRDTDDPTLARELASLEAIFAAGGSWG